MRSVLIKKSELAHNMRDVFVGTTDDGCFMLARHGNEDIRIELPVDGAIDVAASIIVSTARAAVKRGGYTLQAYLAAIDSRIQTRLHEAASKAKDGAS